MAKTETAEYIFTVKEGSPPDSGGDAPTFLMCELECSPNFGPLLC